MLEPGLGPGRGRAAASCARADSRSSARADGRGTRGGRRRAGRAASRPSAGSARRGRAARGPSTRCSSRAWRSSAYSSSSPSRSQTGVSAAGSDTGERLDGRVEQPPGLLGGLLRGQAGVEDVQPPVGRAGEERRGDPQVVAGRARRRRRPPAGRGGRRGRPRPRRRRGSRGCGRAPPPARRGRDRSGRRRARDRRTPTRRRPRPARSRRRSRSEARRSRPAGPGRPAARTRAAGAGRRPRDRPGDSSARRASTSAAAKAIVTLPGGRRRVVRGDVTEADSLVPGLRRRARRRPSAGRAGRRWRSAPSAGTGSSRGARRPRLPSHGPATTGERSPLALQPPHAPDAGRSSGCASDRFFRAAAFRAAGGGRGGERQPDERRRRGPRVGRGPRLRRRAPRPSRRRAAPRRRRARAGARSAAGTARSARRPSRPRTDSSSWARCSAIVRPDVEMAEVVGAQVLEVERPLLGLAELVVEDRVHRPADDRALDLRARVDPDHRGGVVDRVEVVLPRRGLERLLAELRPDGRLRVVERHARPLGGVPRVRPDDHAGVRERPAVRRSAASQRRTNAHLVAARRTPTSRRRARSAGRVEADLARRTSLGSGPASSRTSGRTTRRPSDADALARDRLQLDRLLRLEVVPDEHELGQLVDEPLVRQVVPAEDRVDGVDARAASRRGRSRPGRSRARGG